MFSNILYVIIGGLAVNGVHAYLLVTQKAGRRWSISEHAVLNKKTHFTYMIAHIVGASFMLLFAYNFFLLHHGSTVVFAVACLAAFFQYLQAVLPAKGNYNTPHALAAYSMCMLYIVVGNLGIFTLQLPYLAKVLATPVMLSLIVIFLVTHFIQRKNVWAMQMAMILLYPIGLLLMQIQ